VPDLYTASAVFVLTATAGGPSGGYGAWQ